MNLQRPQVRSPTFGCGKDGRYGVAAVLCDGIFLHCAIGYLYSRSKRRALASTLLESAPSRHDWIAAQYVDLILPSRYLSGNSEPAKLIRVL